MTRSTWTDFRGTFKASPSSCGTVHAVEKNPKAELPTARPRVGGALVHHKHVASMWAMTQSCHSLQHDMVDGLKKIGWLFLCITFSSTDPIININSLRNLFRTDSKSRIPKTTSDVIQQFSDEKTEETQRLNTGIVALKPYKWTYEIFWTNVFHFLYYLATSNSLLSI